MSRVQTYSVSLLSLEDCRLQYSPGEVIELLKAWRRSHTFAIACAVCEQPLSFGVTQFTTCCQQFYFNNLLSTYPVESIAIDTAGFEFILPQMKRMLQKHSKDGITFYPRQEFLVLPDPIYWQVPSTLTYEKVMKLVLGLPMTSRTTHVQPPTKAPMFYNHVEAAPLNYLSLNQRSSGKTQFIRQYAFGKRTELSMRSMITPDPSLRPNEIVLPRRIIDTFDLFNKWIVLNRMPTLQPENFVALRVVKSWNNECIGIPLEIVESLNADFDGDECNLYIVNSLQAQAECETVLNVEKSMGSLTTGLKLAPSQDMLVAYYLYQDDIDFLPYKSPSRDLRKTFRVIYELYGSQTAFSCFDAMRMFYLDVLERRRVFGITLKEIYKLVELSESAIRSSSGVQQDGLGGECVKKLKKLLRKKHTKDCLVAQVESGAKGSYLHLLQMFGALGYQNGVWISNSFWRGLTAGEAMEHAMVSHDALSQTDKIWQPGYGYTKMAYNLQGLHVDYAGQLVDGSTVVETDALETLHHTDLMSDEAFTCLLEEELIHRR